MPQATKGGKIYLNIDRLDLLPSIYYLYIAINNNDEKLDHISEAIKFEITPYPIYPTGRLPLHRGLLMFAPCSWSHKYD